MSSHSHSSRVYFKEHTARRTSLIIELFFLIRLSFIILKCTHLSSIFGQSHLDQTDERQKIRGGKISFKKCCLLRFVLWIVWQFDTEHIFDQEQLCHTPCAIIRITSFVLSSPLTKKTCQDRYWMICSKLSK